MEAFSQTFPEDECKDAAVKFLSEVDAFKAASEVFTGYGDDWFVEPFTVNMAIDWQAQLDTLMQQRWVAALSATRDLVTATMPPRASYEDSLVLTDLALQATLLQNPRIDELKQASTDLGMMVDFLQDTALSFSVTTLCGNMNARTMVGGLGKGPPPCFARRAGCQGSTDPRMAGWRVRADDSSVPKGGPSNRAPILILVLCCRSVL